MLSADLVKEYKFDPNYELLGDFDLWVRISDKYNLIGLIDILEYSRDHPTNYSKKKNKLWIKERRYFYKKFIRIFGIKYYMIFFYILKEEFKEFIKTILGFFR